ncbi:MAG: CRISPR-associated endonuclease Cas1 [Cyanobacteria bacterium P01_H01_bin.21]
MNNTFLSDFLNLKNFQLAWRRVAKNKGCAGVDGETVAQFAYQADEKLAALMRQIMAGTYSPFPLRQLWIPKKDGGWRGLAVPTVRDRIVQQALLNVLHPLLEPQFETCSFAYRPGRSHLMAAQQVHTWQRRGYQWVLDADLVKYFDNVRHERLLSEVAERLPTETDLTDVVLALVEDWMSVGVLTKQGLILPQKGIPQGSVVSPILANVYLDDFDEIMLAAGLKLVRYADDFVLLGKTQGQIERGRQLVADTLSSMELSLHPDKTQITNFQRGFKFVGHIFTGDLMIRQRGKQKQKQRKPKQLIDQEVPLDNIVYADPVGQRTLLESALVEALQSLQQPIPPPLFVVVGYGLREVKPVKIESKEWSWQAGMATLYLVHQGTKLRKDHGRFVVEPPRREKNEPTVEIPVLEVERVLVLENVQLSTAAMSVCLQEQIPVVFLTQMGQYKGHLWSGDFCDLAVEAAQYGRRKNHEFQLKMARQIVAGKILNSKRLLLRLNRKRQIAGMMGKIKRLDQYACGIDKFDNLNSLRGLEGTAARLYFSALGELITNTDFNLTQRTRRPPRDPVNSLLSFGYTLLFNNVLSLILAEGLNPYLGNLHRSDRKGPHLALDLMEEFRSPIVDTMVIGLINKQILKLTDFTWPNKEGGIYLDPSSRRIFLKHFENRISDMVTYPGIEAKLSYRRVIQRQVQQYKQILLTSGMYEPYLRMG